MPEPAPKRRCPEPPLMLIGGEMYAARGAVHRAFCLVADVPTLKAGDNLDKLTWRAAWITVLAATPGFDPSWEIGPLTVLRKDVDTKTYRLFGDGERAAELGADRCCAKVDACVDRADGRDADLNLWIDPARVTVRLHHLVALVTGDYEHNPHRFVATLHAAARLYDQWHADDGELQLLLVPCAADDAQTLKDAPELIPRRDGDSTVQEDLEKHNGATLVPSFHDSIDQAD
jgi:hypothetical protein